MGAGPGSGTGWRPAWSWLAGEGLDRVSAIACLTYEWVVFALGGRKFMASQVSWAIRDPIESLIPPAASRIDRTSQGLKAPDCREELVCKASGGFMLIETIEALCLFHAFLSPQRGSGAQKFGSA